MVWSSPFGILIRIEPTPMASKVRLSAAAIGLGSMDVKSVDGGNSHHYRRPRHDQWLRRWCQLRLVSW